jgi:phosphate transport system permease protein
MADATVVPVARPGATAGPPQPRRLVTVTTDERLSLIGAGACGIAVAMLLFGRLSPLSGALGFALVAYAVFVVAFAVLVSLSEEGPAVRDRLVTVLLYTAALVTFAVLVIVIGFTLFKGRSALTHANFFTDDMRRAGPLDPLSTGGIKHALVGTLWMIGIALAVTVPLGMTAAVYLNEIGGRFSRFVRTIVDAMTALPAIVAGLFGYAAWILTLGNEKSALAASLAISVMMLPIMIRTADVVLRLVPGNLREAAAALGAPQWRTVLRVVLPTARSGLVTAVILATARGVGETAPVLLTAGYTAALNGDPAHGPNVSLSLAAFEFIKSPQPAMVARGFATAAFLMLVVLFLFVVARIVGGHGPGHVSKRQTRRIARASARDAERFTQPAGERV